MISRLLRWLSSPANIATALALGLIPATFVGAALHLLDVQTVVVFVGLIGTILTGTGALKAKQEADRAPELPPTPPRREGDVS